MSAQQPDHELRVNAQLRELMFSQAFPAWLVNILGICIGGTMLYQQVDERALVIWVSISLLILLLRLPAVLAARANRVPDISTWLYYAGLSGTGLMWGVFALFSLPSQAMGLQVLILMTPLLIGLSSAVALNAWLPAFHALIWPLLVSYGGVIVFSSDGDYRVLVSALILCTGFSVAFAHRFNRQTRHTLQLAMNNEKLVQDLSEQNTDLQQAREVAETAIATKDAFLSRMSHELRTPMNGVMGMAQLLADSRLSDKQKQQVSTIQLSAHRLLELINDLLDATSLASDDVQINTEATPVTEITGLLEDSFRSAFLDKGLYMQLTVADDVPLMVGVDRYRINQMLRKLIDNALKFTEQGGMTLTVSVTDENRLVFSVIDTGVGIEEGHLALVSDLFHQADGSADRRFEGSGVGLSIVSSLAELMNGSIAICSTRNEGTQVTVVVEYDEVAAEILAEYASSRSMIDCVRTIGGFASVEPVQPRVLVAEDNPVNQMVIESMLEAMDCDITMADNGNEALACLDDDQFDIVLMDCQMPECDGYQAARKAREAGIKTPIIAVTANTLAGDRQKCLDAGMDDYVAKPFTQEALESIMSVWVRSNDDTDLANVSAA